MNSGGPAPGDSVCWKGATGPAVWGYVDHVLPDGRLACRYGRYRARKVIAPGQVTRWSPGRAEYDRRFWPG